MAAGFPHDRDGTLGLRRLTGGGVAPRSAPQGGVHSPAKNLSTMSTTKSAVQERVNLVRALKNNQPGITNNEIRQIFNTYNFQFNL